MTGTKGNFFFFRNAWRVVIKKVYHRVAALLAPRAIVCPRHLRPFLIRNWRHSMQSASDAYVHTPTVAALCAFVRTVDRLVAEA